MDAKKSYMATFEPLFWIDDRINRNRDYDKGDVYTYSFTKRKSSSFYNQGNKIDNITKQVEYDLTNNEEVVINLQFGEAYGYDEPEYDKEGLKNLAHAYKKYISKIYDVNIFRDPVNTDEYKIQLSGTGSNILQLIQKTLDIVNMYETFIIKNFNKYIKIT